MEEEPKPKRQRRKIPKNLAEINNKDGLKITGVQLRYYEMDDSEGVRPTAFIAHKVVNFTVDDIPVELSWNSKVGFGRYITKDFTKHMADAVQIVKNDLKT